MSQYVPAALTYYSSVTAIAPLIATTAQRKNKAKFSSKYKV